VKKKPKPSLNHFGSCSLAAEPGPDRLGNGKNGRNNHLFFTFGAFLFPLITNFDINTLYYNLLCEYNTCDKISVDQASKVEYLCSFSSAEPDRS